MPRLRERVVRPRHRKLAEIKRPGRDRALATAGLLLCSFMVVWCCGVALRLSFFFYHWSVGPEAAIGSAAMAWVFLFLIGRALFLKPEPESKAA